MTASRIADGRLEHSRKGAEKLFHPPETTSRKSHFLWFPIRHSSVAYQTFRWGDLVGVFGS